MTLSSVNTIWVLLGAAMVFFMQAGFSLCEAGFTRAKNTGNILMKNLMDFCIGTPCFWLFGFGIMFGAGSAVVGWLDPGITKDYSFITPAGVPLWAFAIFQTVFCATSATIVSGSMAERTKFSAYCIYSACISLFIYPISGHWIWGGGWLSQLGFHDFAGSTAVHMVGGTCACIGASMLGPRIGKYDKEGKPKAILGHNITAAAPASARPCSAPVSVSTTRKASRKPFWDIILRQLRWACSSFGSAGSASTAAPR